MGILDNLNANGTVKPAARNTKNTDRADLPKSKFWLNVGYEAEDGRFVNLSQGIALDNIEALKTDTNNEEFNELRASQNELAEDLVREAEGMQPGEERVVYLQVRLRRISERTAADPKTSRYARKDRAPLTAPVAASEE